VTVRTNCSHWMRRLTSRRRLPTTVRVALIKTLGAVVVASVGMLGPVSECTRNSNERALQLAQHTHQIEMDFLDKLISAEKLDKPLQKSFYRRDVLEYFNATLPEGNLKNFAKTELDKAKKLVSEIEKLQKEREAAVKNAAEATRKAEDAEASKVKAQEEANRMADEAGQNAKKAEEAEKKAKEAKEKAETAEKEAKEAQKETKRRVAEAEAKLAAISARVAEESVKGQQSEKADGGTEKLEAGTGGSCGQLDRDQGPATQTWLEPGPAARPLAGLFEPSTTHTMAEPTAKDLNRWLWCT
jgi:hypothetical protein